MGGALKLYNTLTREKQAFAPIDPDNVRMYVCGPTVYDFAHIGNARPVIVFDVLYRLLRHLYGDNHVTYVRNITDVDDKINARAKRDYPDLPLNEAIRAVTEKTADQFHSDVAALGVLQPTVEPRATEHIDGMVAMIQRLLEKGNAYVAEGPEGKEVLFDVPSMPDYGRLSRRNLDDQQAGARIAVESHKKNPADFVLWKESDADEPGWEGVFSVDGSPVAIHGRPGWHIECSVMSEKHLGETFDIHGGGLDLIFPHHENEIAQSCSAHGNHVMANVWMHNGFVQVEGRKMSKSEGNFFTIHELLETENFGGRKWPGEVLRLAMLMTHYREPIDFSVKRLEEAENILVKLRRKAEGAEAGILSESFADAIADDLNTPDYIGHMLSGGVTAPDLLAAGDLLGLNLRPKLADFDVQSFVDQRLALIREKNWAEADRIRDQLAEKGILLKDAKDKETGERITTWEVQR
ncbi:cysteine--tRNA ligase [Martelella endophytica]|uniref:Cysteine--tRNA ligase n=1 Tax=Martelella endophytica TaxID=1486262 RepID=A0A0D5LQX0_MAREN|nr:cysteine--tRNA ligase [Martelella endophytica]AJY46619.1 cysteine--tRNA ligase [Martelella endophytica]